MLDIRNTVPQYTFMMYSWPEFQNTDIYGLTNSKRLSCILFINEVHGILVFLIDLREYA